MNKYRYLTIYLVLVTIWISIHTGCWAKQDHDIILPYTPHYQLTGVVRDIDTQLPVANARVVISNQNMIYAVDWKPLTVFTDSSGAFVVDTIYPGSYTARIYQDDLELASKQLMVVHADKNIEIEIPTELLPDSDVLGDGLDEITWTATALWGRLVVSGPIGSAYYDHGVPAIIKLKSNNGLLEFDLALLDRSQNAIGLIYSNGRIMIYSSDSVYAMSIPSGDLNATIPLNNRVTGLTVSRGIFYSTWMRSIQTRGTDITQVQSSVQTNSSALSFIVKKGDYFWAYDTVRDYLVKITAEGQVVKTYKLFSELDHRNIIVKGMSLDGVQHLWISHNLLYGGNSYYSVFNLN